MNSTFQPRDLIAGRYEVIRWIASGGMGEVYEVEDILTRSRVALKTLRPEISSVAGHVERLRRELLLARRRQHPSLCQVFDLGIHSESPQSPPVTFLTMELLQGRTLGECLREDGPMSPDEILQILPPILEGLEALHSAGVLHRDLKSDNIFLALSKDGGARPVIADFGLALDLTSAVGPGLTHSGMVVGTLEYISPEQLQGQPLTVRSDLYSLGVIVYELLTARRPFSGESPFSEAARRLYHPPEPIESPGGASAERLVSFTGRCLRRDPSERFASAQDALEALRNPGLPRRDLSSRKHWRLGPRGWSVLGGTLAVLIALAFWALPARPRPEPRPANAQAYDFYLRGRAKRDSEGLELLRRSVEIDPSFSPAWSGLGAAYLQSAAPHLQGRAAYEGAETSLRRALDLDPLNRDARLMLPIVMIETGRVEEGVKRLEEMRGQNPADPGALWNLSYGYRFLGHLEKSARLGREALRLRPETGDEASWVFNTLLYQGNFDEFLTSLPSRVDAYTAFYRGYAALYQGNREAASRLFAEAYEVDRDSAYAQTGKAMQLQIVGDTLRGVLLLDSLAMTLHKRGLVDGETLYKTGQAYWLLGQQPKALTQISRALDQGFVCTSYIENDALLRGFWDLPGAREVLEKARRRRSEALKALEAYP